MLRCIFFTTTTKKRCALIEYSSKNLKLCTGSTCASCTPCTVLSVYRTRRLHLELTKQISAHFVSFCVILIQRYSREEFFFWGGGGGRNAILFCRLIVKGTVRPDWICMRVVSLESPLKAHQPL